jgi:hypothetical protein
VSAVCRRPWIVGSSRPAALRAGEEQALGALGRVLEQVVLQHREEGRRDVDERLPLLVFGC